MPCKAAALTAQVDKKEKKDLPKAGFLFRHCRRTGMIMMAVVMPLSLLTDVCLEDWSTAVQLVQVMGRRWGLVSGKVVNAFGATCASDGPPLGFGKWESCEQCVHNFPTQRACCCIAARLPRFFSFWRPHGPLTR